MVVYGFGEKKTPKPFVVACDKFIYTEVLRKEASSVAASAAGANVLPTAEALPTVVPSGDGGSASPLPCRQGCRLQWSPQSASSCRLSSKGRTSQGGRFLAL